MRLRALERVDSCAEPDKLVPDCSAAAPPQQQVDLTIDLCA